LNADLVRAARFELYFEPSVDSPAILAGREIGFTCCWDADPEWVGYIFAGEDAVVENGQFAARIVGGDDDRLGHAVALVEVVDPGAFVGLDVALDDGPVDFRDRAVFELRGESLGGADVAREDDRAGDRAVEPVGQAKVDVSFFPLALAIIRLHLRFQAIDAVRRLGEQAGGLVDHQARAGVVEDIEHTCRSGFPSLTWADTSGWKV